MHYLRSSRRKEHLHNDPKKRRPSRHEKKTDNGQLLNPPANTLTSRLGFVLALIERMEGEGRLHVAVRGPIPISTLCVSNGYGILDLLTDQFEFSERADTCNQTCTMFPKPKKRPDGLVA